MGLNETDTFLVLKPMAEWRKPDKAWLIGQIRTVIEGFPGIAYGFTQPIDMRVSEMLTGSRGDIAVKMFGPDLATLNRLTGEIYNRARKRSPARPDVYTRRTTGVQYLQAEVDRHAAGRFGLSVDDIAMLLRTQARGRSHRHDPAAGAAHAAAAARPLPTCARRPAPCRRFA